MAMSKQKPISPSAQRELDRLYNQYENRIISVEEYEIRRRELFSKLGGIPSPNKNRSNINPKSLKKQKVDKPQDDYGKIKKIFPILLIGLVLIGVSFKVIPGLEEKGSIIVRTIEESLPFFSSRRRHTRF